MALRGSIGVLRARIAPHLSGEAVAEMLALAEMTISCGGSLSFGMRHKEGITAALIDLGLVEATRPPEQNLTPGTRKLRLTKLGWLTLITRCEAEMAHLLPAEPASCEEAA